MDTTRIENIETDYLIVGGGIVGAGIFRDLSLHEQNVVIIDRGDFGSQTSQGSSKMLHGGIRYLENLDFGLVFEALKEKNLWLKLAPNLAKEIPFYLPVYRNSKWPLFFMRMGLFLYDLLSLFKNSPHKVLNTKETLNHIPKLKTDGLTGSGVYYDGIIDDSKLALNCILDGINSQTQALNYTEITALEKQESRHITHLRNTQTGQTFKVTAREIIFATGPFTDQVMKELDIPWNPVLLPSKGSHLWLDKDALPIKDAMVLQTNDGRIIFVIPQREAILVGTTEIPLNDDDDFFDIKPSKEEVDYLLASLKEYFPEVNISHDDILSTFAAVRPLVKESNSSAKTSRKHKVYTPTAGINVIVGGKYTTFRKMAQDICKKLLGKSYNPKLSLNPLQRSALITTPYDGPLNQKNIDFILKNEFVHTYDDLIYRRLSYLGEKQISAKDSETLKSYFKNDKTDSSQA